MPANAAVRISLLPAKDWIMMRKETGKEFPDLVKAGESLTCIISTFDCRTVPYE